MALKSDDPAWHAMRRLQRVWCQMRRRCSNPRDQNYRFYGERGIMVCPEWETAFLVFHEWAINAGYRRGLSIDRINTNGNYSPENCRWIEQRLQSQNTRSNHILEYRGRRQPMVCWAQEMSLPVTTLELRINRLRWTVDKALETPHRGWGPHHSRIRSDQ